MNDTQQEPEPMPMAAMELVANLMERSMTETQHVTDWVMEAMRKENAELHGIIAAIRQHVDELLSKPYMPHREDLLTAVFDPHPDLVAHHMEPVLRKHWSRGEGSG